MILMEEKVVFQSSFCLVSRLHFEMNLANLTYNKYYQFSNFVYRPVFEPGSLTVMI